MTIVEVACSKIPSMAGSTPGDKWWVITVVLLVGLALVKAAAVGLYFMHLIDEKKAFIMIVCFPLVLAVVLIIGLIPDVVFKHG